MKTLRTHQSDYVVLLDHPDGLVIKDMDIGNISVTNDIENVVVSLRSRLHVGRRLFYFDSSNQLDEVVLDNHLEFERFRFGGSPEIVKALQKEGLMSRII